MANNNKDHIVNAVNDFISSEMPTDEELKAAVKKLAIGVLDDMFLIREFGDLKDKLQVGKTMIPHLVRMLQTNEENEELAVLRKQMEDIHTQILGTTPTKLHVVNGVPELPSPEAPEDTPN